MRKILIVGAGQSGLHLAHGLLTHGYDVTLVTGQTSTEIRTGRPAITQFTFPSVLEYERTLHLDFWSAQAPHLEGVTVHFYPPGSPPLAMSGRFEGYALSVDRRVKMADWLEYFEDRGGKVVIHGVTVTDLDYFSRMFDLVVIAVGAGELGALFDLDRSRFSGARPRVLSQAHIYDVESDDMGDEHGWVLTTAVAGGGVLVPTLTSRGPCHSLFLIDRGGGPMDVSPDSPAPEEQLRRMKEVLQQYAPEYYERVKSASLADGRSTVIEEVVPKVRNPVGTLPSGGKVLGIADVVITSDPAGGQGWNNSTRCAESYLASILQRGDRPFDEAFLHQMFENFWEYGQHVERFMQLVVSSMLEGQLPEHMQEVMGAAMQYPEVADRWIQGWNYPPSYQEWLFDPELTRKYLAEVAASHSQ